MKVYLCQKRCCPSIETQDDSVLIDDDKGNTVRLSKEYWNGLVQRVRSGELKEI